MQLTHQMALDQRLQLKLTPELKQSIDILQISSLDLASFLQEISLENPLLEIQYSPPSIYNNRQKKGNRSSSTDFDRVGSIASHVESLSDYLTEQLRHLDISPVVYRSSCFLAGNIDENGFLTVPLDEASDKLQQSQEVIKQALEAVQSLEPSGIGARTLEECLSLQIIRDPERNPYAADIVHAYLPDLGKGKFQKIASALHLSIEEVNQALQYIKSLNPRPGLIISPTITQYIVPDAEIAKENERYTVRLLDNHLPKLIISTAYKNWTEPSNNEQPNETCKYVRGKLQEAKFMMKSLEKRQITLYQVILAIFEEQYDFLERGVTALKPMDLKTIADKTNFHISTISRAIRDKYVQTPVGLYELNYFFCSGILANDGDYASSKNLQLKIKTIIENENKDKPLSDQQIAQLLKETGVPIARRTVTKYREKMNLLSSVFRK